MFALTVWFMMGGTIYWEKIGTFDDRPSCESVAKVLRVQYNNNRFQCQPVT